MKPNPLTKEERVKIRSVVENGVLLKYHYIENCQEAVLDTSQAISRIMGIPLTIENSELNYKIEVALENYVSKDSFKDFLAKLDEIKRDYQIKKLTE